MKDMIVNLYNIWEEKFNVRVFFIYKN